MSKSIWFQPLSIEDFKDSSINMDKHLGIEIVEIGDDFIVGRMPVIEKTKQPYGPLCKCTCGLLSEYDSKHSTAMNQIDTYFN